jgi:WD40 repeat protein
MRALCILNQIEKTVMIGGDSGIACSYDLSTHDLIDVWSVGARITALACLSLEEGGFITAAGTSEGNLIIRQDWEEIIPRHHECGIKTINDVKFSKNGILIAVASTDKNVYLLNF